MGCSSAALSVIGDNLQLDGCEQWPALFPTGSKPSQVSRSAAKDLETHGPAAVDLVTHILAVIGLETGTQSPDGNLSVFGTRTKRDGNDLATEHLTEM